jgi:hypothetical protein
VLKLAISERKADPVGGKKQSPKRLLANNSKNLHAEVDFAHRSDVRFGSDAATFGAVWNPRPERWERFCSTRANPLNNKFRFDPGSLMQNCNDCYVRPSA